MPGLYSEPRQRPEKLLRGVPNHWAYRCKLEAKWSRRGYSVRFV